MPVRVWLAVLMLCAPMARAAPRIVAAENFYGSVAAAIAGPGAVVTSILSNPNTDPHEFELSPSVARAIAGADIVAYNGAGYDPWMTRLLAASPAPGRQAIEAALLIGAPADGNPHLWYDPATMPAMAAALAAALTRADPAHAADYAERRAAYVASLVPLQRRIAAMRQKYAGVPVTATEPIFGLMAKALGLVMKNERFQLAVMNGTEPRASDMAALEDDLRAHRVRALITNAQVTDNATRILVNNAHAFRVAIVGVTETMPAGASYPGWMLAQLDRLDHVLAAGD